MGKMCPILSVTDPESLYREIHSVECRKGRCAWWDETSKACAIHMIGRAVQRSRRDVRIT